MCQEGECGGLVWAVGTHPWLVGLAVVDVKIQRDLRYHLVESLLRENGVPKRKAAKPIGGRYGAI